MDSLCRYLWGVYCIPWVAQGSWDSTQIITKSLISGSCGKTIAVHIKSMAGAVSVGWKNGFILKLLAFAAFCSVKVIINTLFFIY